SFRRSPKSHGDLGTDLDHAIGRNLEIIGRVVGTTGEPDEQPILPARHAGTHGKPERAPRKEERGRHDFELPAKLAGSRKRSRHVWPLHKAKRSRIRENLSLIRVICTRSVGSTRGSGA